MITPSFNKFTLSVQINNFADSYKSEYEPKSKHMHS